jgi:hypothetical protein
MSEYPLPLWFPLLLILIPILTMLFFRAWRDEKWRVGYCPQCGVALDGVSIQGRHLLCTHGSTTCSIWCLFVKARAAQVMGDGREEQARAAGHRISLSGVTERPADDFRPRRPS